VQVRPPRRLLPAALLAPVLLAPVLLAPVLLAPAPVAAAPAAERAGARVVSAVPAAGTPQVLDGSVQAMAQVGGVLVAGGNFTQVAEPGSSGSVARSGLVAFDADSGDLRPGFSPVLDGPVNAVVAGPTPGTVLVGGAFDRVNGIAAKSLVLLRLADGSVDDSFAVPVMNGVVQALRVVEATHRVYVGGTFKRVGGEAHGGLVALDTRTGRVDEQVGSSVALNHNWTDDAPPGRPRGAVGVASLDVSPDGRRLVAVGNFREVDGRPRDQVVMLDISGRTAVVRPDWRTRRLEPACLAAMFDSYARAVSFSPDGGYFVLGNSGGGFPGTVCDSVSRWETGASGDDVQPTWVAATGGDSILSTAVTAAAVYAGGHQRWLNNDDGVDAPGPGAVPRPGLAALDPVSGIPLDWNPGRNPRGVGAGALLATSQGLWVGSDTSYIGNRRYLRQRIALFPLRGGAAPASKRVPGLPGTLWSVNEAGRLTTRAFDGTGVGAAQPAPAQLPTGGIRAATLVGDRLFYARADGLYVRRLTRTSFGPQRVVDPYNDPAWSRVQTGSGQTYRGEQPSLYRDLGDVTSLMFDGRSRLYSTLAGRDGLFVSRFSPDSGIVSSSRQQVPGVDLPPVSAAFLAEGHLYWVPRGSKDLTRAAFNGYRLTGPRRVVGHLDPAGLLFLGPPAR
jgi:hypothetical protein